MSGVARNSRVDIIDRQSETECNAPVGASAFSPRVSIELYNREIDTGLGIFFLPLIFLRLDFFLVALIDAPPFF